METEARKRARAKYLENHKRENLRMELPEGTKERWKAAAAAKGQSLTAYIAELVEADIAKAGS